jgi:FtsZ-binding cell division protein ZapB
MTVTVERLDRAIGTVADVIVRHDIDLMPTIRRLEAERDKLTQATADMDYAREILQKRAQQGKQHHRGYTELSILFY